MTDTRTGDPTVRELPLAAGGDLELRLGANRVRLRVVDGDRVVIRGETDHDLERDLEIQSGEGWVRVSDGPVGSLRFGPLTVRSGGHVPDLDVDVPRSVRISVRTLSGDIDAEGIAGPSRWQTASGRIRIATEGGPLSIDTVSGDALVDARAPIDLTCRTVSGAVRARAPKVNSLDLATTSGDVNIDAALAEGASHSITSVSGDVRLMTSTEVYVDLQSVTGDIRAAMPHRVEGTRGRRSIVIGSGRVRVAVRTLSGDVEVRPAGSSPDSAIPGSSFAAGDASARNSAWAEFSRDWAEYAKDWAQWGKAWAEGMASGRASARRDRGRNASWGPQPAPGAPEAAASTPPSAPESAPTPDVASPSTAMPAAEATPAAAATPPADAATPVAADRPVGADQPFADAPTAARTGDALDDTSPVPAPTPADIETARLEILRQLERGELDVESAAARLAALETIPRPEA